MNGGRIGRPISNIRFSTSSPLFGQSGAATIQLDFDIYDPGRDYIELFTHGQYFNVYDVHNAFDTSRTFYLARRTHSEGVTHICAYDVISNADALFDSTGIVYAGDPPTVSGSEVLELIKQQCDYTAITASFSTEMRFTKEMLSGKTCRQILEMFAEAVCGIWVSTADDGIALMKWGGGLHSDSGLSEIYTAADLRGEQKISTVIVTNTEKDETEEFDGADYGINIEIDTPFYDEAVIAAQSRLDGASYTAWNCERALLKTSRADMAAVSMITTDTFRYAFNFNVEVDSTGIYFSGGAEPQDEQQWQYKTKMQRELAQRLKLGKTVGNVQINKKGVEFIDYNKVGTRSGGSVQKYGFSVDGEITEYEGALVNKVTPNTATFSDNTAVITYPNGKAFRYTIESDGSGNITAFSKEAVTV